MGNRRVGWTAALALAVSGGAATGGTAPGGPEWAEEAGRVVQADAASEESGARLERTLLEILQNAAEPSSEVRLTPLPEPDVNAYLAHQAVPHLPVGIRAPSVRIGEDSLSAEAVIDLDAIRDSRERAGFDPIQFLGGRLPVTASGRVRSGGGVARVDVEAVTVGGIPVPVNVLQELVRYFTRTPDQPAGTSLDAPIPLPYGITELRLSPGLAVIVQ